MVDGGGAVGVGGGGAEDLVLGGDLGEFAFEALVLAVQAAGRAFEGGEFVFEFFDVAFLAFAEGALAVDRSCVSGLYVCYVCSRCCLCFYCTSIEGR